MNPNEVAAELNQWHLKAEDWSFDESLSAEERQAVKMLAAAIVATGTTIMGYGEYEIEIHERWAVVE